MIFNHVTVTLRGQETAVSGSGKHQTTHVNKFLDQKIPLSGNVEVPSGKPVRFEAVLPLPANSFKPGVRGDQQIRESSGDHAGWALMKPSLVNWARPVPSTLIV